MEEFKMKITVINGTEKHGVTYRIGHMTGDGGFPAAGRADDGYDLIPVCL